MLALVFFFLKVYITTVCVIFHTVMIMFAVVPRIQFLAIEVARNREGCNDAVSRQTTSDSLVKDAAVSS